MNYLSLYMLHLCGDTDLLMPFLVYTVLPRLCFSGLAPLFLFYSLSLLSFNKYCISDVQRIYAPLLCICFSSSGVRISVSASDFY